MHPISVIQNNSILEELKQFPLQAVIWGILEKNNKGQIFELSDKSILMYDPKRGLMQIILEADILKLE